MDAQPVLTLNRDELVKLLSDPAVQNSIKSITASPMADLEHIAVILATIIAAVSVFLVWRQLRADHERSRRERAVALLLEWSRSVDSETSGVIQLVRKLDAAQCAELEGQRPFTLLKTEENLTRVMRCLKGQFPDLTEEQLLGGSTSEYHLNNEHVRFIRFQTVKYLNTLEGVLTAWNSAIADRKILEDQFAFIAAEKEKSLELFRLANAKASNGIDSFPSIRNFVRHYAPPAGEAPLPPVA